MHKLILRLALLGAISLGLSGCYQTTFLAGPNASGAPSMMYNGAWYHGVVAGLVDLSGPIPLDAVCPSGWARIDYERSFLNVFVEGLTSEIYSPSTVTIYCNSGASYDAIKDGHGKIVMAIPRTER